MNKSVLGIFSAVVMLLRVEHLQAADECVSELKNMRPKIYVANFFVTYGKKSMGKAIGDNIAEKFSADGRFEVLPRESISEEMQWVLKKDLKPEAYLEKTVDLALARKADCVVFGRIARQGNLVSFSVRMAAVATGDTRLKLDEAVGRAEAADFFEKTGSALVRYFVTVTPEIIPAVVEEAKPETQEHTGLFIGLSGGTGIFSASKPIGSDRYSADGFSGQIMLRLGYAINPNVILHMAASGQGAYVADAQVILSGPFQSGVVAGASHSTGLVGVGLTSYSTQNYFMSFTVGTAMSRLKYDYLGTSVSGVTSWGGGIELMIGHEWQVARKLGLGLAFVGHYSYISENSVALNNYYAGLALSASYN